MTAVWVPAAVIPRSRGIWVAGPVRQVEACSVGTQIPHFVRNDLTAAVRVRPAGTPAVIPRSRGIWVAGPVRQVEACSVGTQIPHFVRNDNEERRFLTSFGMTMTAVWVPAAVIPRSRGIWVAGPVRQVEACSFGTQIPHFVRNDDEERRFLTSFGMTMTMRNADSSLRSE